MNIVLIRFNFFFVLYFIFTNIILEENSHLFPRLEPIT